MHGRMSHATIIRMTDGDGLVDPPENVRMAVLALVKKHGAVKAAGMLGIGREPVLRVAGGLPVRAGTIAQVKERLSKEQ